MTDTQGAQSPEQVAHGRDDPVFVEPRWPVALAVSVFIAITVTLRVVQPHRESLGPPWLVPGIELGLLVALIAGTRRMCAGAEDGCAPCRLALSSRSLLWR